jgi:cytoskeleton protein RodZ
VEAETPGVILRRARLKAGFRKVDIARQLHLSVARIKALEQDQYHQFQSEVFVKGSLRAYGKFLNLDCDALIATYNWFIRANHDVSDLLEPVINIKKPLTQSNHLAGKWVGVFIGIAVLILWFAQPVDRVVKPSPALPAVVESPVEIDIRDRSIIEALGVGAQSPAQDPVVAAVSDIEGNAAADLLSLTFSGDCWVEVRDRDGEIIFASMRHAGDKLELTGRAPFKVLLGYAPVVSMDYNGESVNIDSNARTNSARLVVGST